MSAWQDGFYVAYLTGKAGQGLAILAFKKGRITGADMAGVLFDGEYSDLSSGNIGISLSVRTPPNVTLIQGGTSGLEGLHTKLDFEIPADFSSQPFIRINGPRGPINTKLVKLRDLDD